MEPSPSLQALFKFEYKNVSSEYKNKIDFEITESGFSRSIVSISFELLKSRPRQLKMNFQDKVWFLITSWIYSSVYFNFEH